MDGWTGHQEKGALRDRILDDVGAVSMLTYRYFLLLVLN